MPPSPLPPSRVHHPLRGIGFILVALCMFACLDAIAKHLAASYPVAAIVWVRYLVQAVLTLLVVGPSMGLALLKTRNLRLQLLRSGTLVLSSLIFLAALARLPLAEATSIAFLAPMIVAVLAGPMLHERVDGRTWGALAGGFAGVLLIVRPGSELFNWAALLVLFCTFLMALYQMLTRKLAGREHNMTTLFYPAITAVVVVPIFFPLGIELPRNATDAALFGAVGLLGSLSHFCLIRAYDHAPASTLAPFSYAQIVMATALGWLVFGQFPDGVALAGMAVIAASGVYLILSHRRPAGA